MSLDLESIAESCSHGTTPHNTPSPGYITPRFKEYAMELTKRCTKCGETKALDEFSRDRDGRDGRRNHCKACRGVAFRAWREANAEQERERKRAWREANAEHVREYNRTYYEANTERERERNRAWRESHPEARWASGYRRRAKRYGHNPHVEPFTYAEVIETYGNGCAHCPDGEFEHLDHYPVPVALGGPHSLENVRPSCASCNQAGAAVRTTEAIAA